VDTKEWSIKGKLADFEKCFSRQDGHTST